MRSSRVLLAVLVAAATARADTGPSDGQLMGVSMGDGQVVPTNASLYVGVWGQGQAVIGRVTQGSTRPDVTGTQVGGDSWGSVFVYRLALPALSPDAGAAITVEAPIGQRDLGVVVGEGPDHDAPVIEGTPSASARYVDVHHYNVTLEIDPPADRGGIGYYVVSVVDGGTVGYQLHDADARSAREQIFVAAVGASARPCYVITATDLAGNAGPPSEPACVDLEAARKAAPCACGSAGGGPGAWAWWLAAVTALRGRRARR